GDPARAPRSAAPARAHGGHLGARPGARRVPRRERRARRTRALGAGLDRSESLSRVRDAARQRAPVGNPRGARARYFALPRRDGDRELARPLSSRRRTNVTPTYARHA